VYERRKNREAKSFFGKSNGKMDKGTGRAMKSRFRCLFSSQTLIIRCKKCLQHTRAMLSHFTYGVAYLSWVY